ncbi:hypothetical protein IP88_00660 [alpha proteobacterium AAP81b]|nr:hypothetical protein IP88_00660 [alpha proteobacterium AAP81b]
MAVNFYQLATRGAEAVLPALAVKAMDAGHRIVVRAEAAQLALLDAALWRFAADSFVPHGIDTALGPERAARQPLLLSEASLPAANGADCLIQVGGDLPDDLGGLARALFLFDAEGTEVARARWRRLGEVTRVYWREGEGGRFEKAG